MVSRLVFALHRGRPSMMAAGAAGTVAGAAFALCTKALALVCAPHLAAAIGAAERFNIAQLNKFIEHLAAAFALEFQKRHNYRLLPHLLCMLYYHLSATFASLRLILQKTAHSTAL
jgi:hypothetical protein